MDPVYVDCGISVQDLRQQRRSAAEYKNNATVLSKVVGTGLKIASLDLDEFMFTSVSNLSNPWRLGQRLASQRVM